MEPSRGLEQARRLSRLAGLIQPDVEVEERTDSELFFSGQTDLSQDHRGRVAANPDRRRSHKLASE